MSLSPDWQRGSSRHDKEIERGKSSRGESEESESDFVCPDTSSSFAASSSTAVSSASITDSSFAASSSAVEPSSVAANQDDELPDDDEIPNDDEIAARVARLPPNRENNVFFGFIIEDEGNLPDQVVSDESIQLFRDTTLPTFPQRDYQGLNTAFALKQGIGRARNRASSRGMKAPRSTRCSPG
ncbi:hypothetical protein BFW01_g10551 [Lasiodiplodia theobromae]|uniref:Uncharacterized protein n=1 Tax=Lasiodiplodia theobromae TaxID=45133 RepID=A0A8H7MA83_9PEZI|nr:uncharacterized protein LTHEOB_6545 [Lasiodiplodia theobromae]KAF4543879.1 hypothetical protein LTHEOB_6545 [Lasiodiplodia theobromae]KAF9629348.1 hypothetical protein BFW01_g10551 [Lasiodiplodia theobromae]